jgi:hypothetical protein
VASAAAAVAAPPSRQLQEENLITDGGRTTGVSPTGNIEPLIGVHAIVIGAVPPTIAGGAYVMATGCPSADCRD